MSRGWDSSSPVLLVTLRHSGSHSALSILEEKYQRHAMTENFRRDVGITKPPLWFCHSEPENMALIHKRMSECGLLISTMRNPVAIAESWIHRGLPLDKWFMDMWTNLFKLQAEYDGMWLPVDTPDRDMRLQAISKRLCVDIKTDWTHKGVTTHDQQWKSGMTLDEVSEFYMTLPFEQFGYKTMKKVAKKRAKKVVNKGRGFVFTGDKVGGCDPASIVMYGITFKLNGAVRYIPDEIAVKIENNQHFTEK